MLHSIARQSLKRSFRRVCAPEILSVSPSSSSSCQLDSSRQCRTYHCTRISLNNKPPSPPADRANEDIISGTPFVLYDSLSQSLREIPVMVKSSSNAADSNKHPPTEKALAWYTCGPTTYSAMHLGHARTYVWFDMMRRVLEVVCAIKGAPPPLFVMNITDVDDKIIAAANETQQDPMTISRTSETKFWKDMERLGCRRPHITTRVTEYVDSDIISYIERLVEQEMAYVSNDGVYFDVKNFEQKMGKASHYGKLAGGAVKPSTANNADEDSSMPPSDHALEKRDRRDFALWKLRKEEEQLFWDSPWGEGRPGWHIECSAMIEAIQRQFRDTHTFLVHAGGVDLKFPHHANEIAQAEAYHYKSCHCPTNHSHNEWIPHWVHTGHLMIKDAKMSKSLKNFLTVDELWCDYDPASSSILDSPADDFRLWCLLGGSYGHREEYSRSKIRGARQTREKILRFLLDGERWLNKCSIDGDAVENQSKRWSNEDHALYTTINQATKAAYRALLDNMRGTTYVAELVQISEVCNSYIRQHEPSKGRVVEPIKVGLQATRDLLSLVGFSELTVRCGIVAQEHSIQENSTQSFQNNYVVGGETALIEELVQFRASVREAALAEVSSKKGTDCDGAKAVLKACDELRHSLPKIGVEVMDKGQGKSSSWRFCVPKQDSQT